MITQSQLKKLLHYDPKSGVFTWKPRALKQFKTKRAFSTWTAKHQDKIAGSINYFGTKKYISIKPLGEYHLAHRLAWLYMTGSFPKEQIDHVDGNGLNNAFANLRSVTQKENAKNLRMYKNNTSGFTGVAWRKKIKKWQANIRVNKKNIYLGVFHDLADAIKARKEAEFKYGFHKNHGGSL
ncbi:HNH endonuclease [Shewanella phage X14]|uniref:HNH nuclease n=1 Tax=Shewanella phage X14 TaxID=2576871 RepID=A0A4P8NFE9_9CAUD|nr:HNH endonuclease [Shewanella phage X14]QCQ65314.1 HNH endonuclease [Shewanella phage X14]